MRDDDQLLLAGSKRRLVWGADQSGVRRAQEFFESLSASDQAKFEVWFSMMAETGVIRSSEKFRQESPNLFVFKIFKKRIACFNHDRELVLIYGFTKKTTSDKRTARHLKTAAALRDTYTGTQEQ